MVQCSAATRHLAVGGVLAAMLAVGGSARAQDPAQGKADFARCSVCHAVNGVGGKIGPELTGVVGRHAAAVPGYAYSAALKGYNVVWTPDVLDKFLAAPQQTVPGTKMAYPGVASATDRTNIIAYLRASGSGK